VIQKAENMEVVSGSSESDDELEDITVEKQRPEWDCESILSESSFSCTVYLIYRYIYKSA